MDEKVGKLDNRAEAELKIALAKYDQCQLEIKTCEIAFHCLLHT